MTNARVPSDSHDTVGAAKLDYSRDEISTQLHDGGTQLSYDNEQRLDPDINDLPTTEDISTEQENTNNG